MSDAPSVPDFPVHVVSGLSPENKATFTDQMTRAGYSAEDVAARLSGVAVQPSPEKVADTAQRLRDQWSGDKATLDAALAKLEAQSKAPAGSANAIPEGLQPPADGAAYKLNFGSHASMTKIENLTALHSELTSGFLSAGIPRSMGQPILEAMLSGIDQTSDLNETQLADYRQNQRAMLSKAGNVDELVRLAAVALVGCDPDTIAMLRDHDALDSAQVISALAGAGRLKERREGK